MQTGRSALEAPVPSRRTACRHVPPSLRSTPCQSETGPTAPPCRMEQVTTSNYSPFSLTLPLGSNPLTMILKCCPALNSLGACCLSHWCGSIKGLKLSVRPAAELQWSGNYDLRKFCISAEPDKLDMWPETGMVSAHVRVECMKFCLRKGIV